MSKSRIDIQSAQAPCNVEISSSGEYPHRCPRDSMTMIADASRTCATLEPNAAI
jgi:hypothetical protein